MPEKKYMQTMLNKYEQNKLEFGGMKYCAKHDVHFSYKCIECETTDEDGKIIE